MASMKQNISKIPALTVSELEKNNQSAVWVFNMSGSADVAKEFPRGIINIAINDGIGNTIGIKVPITWVPVDMTTQVTKNALTANPQFRRLVAQGVLKIVSEEHALPIINSDEGKKEYRRINSNDKYAGDLGAVTTATDDVVIATTDVNPIVMSVVTRDDLDEEACLSILESNEIIFAEKDFEYLARNSRYAGVKDWAVQRL